MKSLSINLPDENYNIFIEKGLLDKVGYNIKEIYKGEKIAIVTDDNVYRIYGEKIKNILEKSDFKIKFVVIENGEKSKSITVLQEIYNGFLDFNLTRSDLIITFGGGVVGDIGGFAAATFLRGVPFIQIPTTLLSQIDSSVGGKVAVNLKRGKNLIGNFYHPKAVFIDPKVLKSLDNRVFNDGLGECIKYGCIRDEKLFSKLEGYNSYEELYNDIEYIIHRCCSIKKEFVEDDEKDTGKRMILNFGHTIGHAIERYFNYGLYTHGEAVAIGMYMMTNSSEKIGETNTGTAERIKKLLLKYNLPYASKKVDIDKIIETVSLDKKRKGNNINLILIKSIGESFIKKIKKEEVSKYVIKD